MFAIKSMHINPMSCVKVNNQLSGWFECPSGVKQADVLSSTLLSLFINDLAVDIKIMNLGVSFGNKNISILLYADDIVIVAENEDNIQAIITYMHQWCRRLRFWILA